VNAPPLVSVVAIFLNAERFLEEAIRSVFAQTHDRWELLLVDDGSSDGSTAIARGWAEREPERVRYLEHPGHQNQGMSASRNAGLRQAQGKYLALLDADDVWLPEKLTRQVAILEAHPEVALLYGAPLYWFGWTGQSEDGARDYVIDLKLPSDQVYQPPALLVPFLRRQAPTPCPSDVLVRRSAAERVGGFEAHFTGVNMVYEDQGFFSKLLLDAPAFASSETWDRYRQHPESCYAVSKSSGGRERARRYFLRWFQDYLRRKGVTSGPVWDTVRSELRQFGVRARITGTLRRAARATLPLEVRSWLGNRIPGLNGRAANRVRLGGLRRLTPVSRQFGWDRGGLPVDRYYIEQFLQAHAGDIRGRVLEARDDAYTRRFGGAGVAQADVLHPTRDNPRATIVADLTRADSIADDTFDCVVLTQVLPFIPDVQAAVKTLHRILRPGGVALVTMPGISQIVRYDMDRWGDYWRFTSRSAQRLFETAFPSGHIAVQAHGNVLVATAFLHGLSTRDLRPHELEYRDPDYEVLITVRAVKHA
jgi:glycosyltransferase involved in cell wall biosynthesis